MNEQQPGSARDAVVTVDRSEDEVITNYRSFFPQYFGRIGRKRSYFLLGI